MNLDDVIASTASAQAQMQFQERMSNTAHQREVADLKAAGLNPVLSAGGNGASTPEGASGDYSAVLGMLAQSMQTNAKAVNSLGKSTANAIQALVQDKLGPAVQNAKEQYEHDQQMKDKFDQQDNQAVLSSKLFGTPFGIWLTAIAHEKGYDSGMEMLEDVFYDLDSALTGRGAKHNLRNGLKQFKSMTNSKDLVKNKRYHVTIGKRGFWSY